MLDDLKMIHQRDAQDALGVASKQWQQLVFDYGLSFSATQHIANVVLAGMGGSALPGVYMQSWPRLNVPFEIVRDYRIPDYVNEHTVFIVSSYSGNTEETLAMLAEAESRSAQIVVIAADGRLAQHAAHKNYPVFAVPANVQPRMATFYFLTALIQLFEPLKLVKQGSLAELHEAATRLSEQIANWQPDVATSKNLPKQLALEIIGKTLIVYSGPKLFPAANKWKIAHNENAKQLAWCNQYPEFNHNEFIGWSGQPVSKPFTVVEIQSNLEDPRVQKRFAATEQLLSGKRPHPVVVRLIGDTVLHQLLWSSMLGDFVSIYVALLNGVNPTPVDLVEKLKQVLHDEA